MEEEVKKFTEADMIVGILLCLMIDVFCAAAEFITLFTIGALISVVVKGGAMWGIDLWLKNKETWLPSGVGTQVVKYFGGLIPFSLTVTFIILFLLHNRGPKGVIGRAAGALKTAAKV